MNSTAISLLKEVINGTTDVQTLRETLGIKEWQFNEHVKKLLQDGFIKKDGNIINLQDNAKTALLKEVSQKWNLENLLRGANELVFSYLIESLTVNEIVTNTGLSTATIYRTISDLEAIGAIKKEPDTQDFHWGKAPERISIDKSKENLMNFARILKTEREKMYEPDAEIIYKDSTKILKKVGKRKVTEGELTAFSLFADYDIKYESPFDYYIKQEEPLDVHDIIIHSVLIAHNTNDKMGLIMSIVFYVHNKTKIDTAQLRKTASSFGIADVWLDIESYVRRKTIKNTELFLPWDEFLAKAELYNIDPKKYLLPAPTPSLFSDIGKHIARPTKIYLLGGENMRIKNLKAATKDCDIVVDNKKDFEILRDTIIKELKYERIVDTEYSQQDLRLYPDEILIHPDRSRVDIFTKRIMKDMSLSDVMIQTADYVDYGNLKVGILRNEYVFLLKAVASREGDIQDMAMLAQGSLNQPREFEHGKFDWEEVWREIIHQEKMNPIRNFTVDIFDQISFLAEQTGVVAPILDRLRRHVIEQLVMRIVRGGMQPLKEIVSLLIGGDISEQMIRNRIDALVKEGIVIKLIIEKEVFVSSNTVPIFPYKDWQANPKNMELYLSWRFPMREVSLLSTISKFTEEIIPLGYNSIGHIDDVIVNHLDTFLDYENEYFPEEPHKSVGAVRACIGLSNPELANNGKSNFYIMNFEKFRNTEVELVNTVSDRRQTS